MCYKPERRMELKHCVLSATSEQERSKLAVEYTVTQDADSHSKEYAVVCLVGVTCVCPNTA